MIMRMSQIASAIASILFATISAAGDFDGALPLLCTVKQSNDCLPTKAKCDSVISKNNNASTIGIDFAKKQIRSPYRKALLPVANAATNTDSLVLQGGDLYVVWSALVDRKTGALTVALADSAGAYVYFGVCKVADIK
jgi:hypothetical protein